MQSPIDRTQFDLPKQVVYPSREFYIGAGTMVVDLRARKVLLARLNETDELWRGSTVPIDKRWELPRGRKNIGETIEKCATRETEEETGYSVALLTVPLDTRQTPPKESRSDFTITDGGNIAYGRSKEAFAQMLHYHPNSGALTVASFFVAEGDSTAAPDKSKREYLSNGEPKYDVKWVDYHQAERMMMNTHFQDVVKKGFEVVARYYDK